MGLLNKVWSGLDFWDKKENTQQRDQFKAQAEEERRRKAAEAQARAQANATRPTTQPSQQQNVSVNDVPRKPTSVTVDAPRQNQNLQVYKPTTTPTVKVEAPTPEQIAHNNKIKELDTLRDSHMARATEEAKKRTSWFDRQFMDRNWTKDAEATAISRATRDYQDKYGWNNDEDVIQYQRGARQKVEESAKSSTSQWIAPVISTARVGTGIVQGGAGLYDLATPGKGTNRLSQAADKKAVEQDTLAKDLGIDKAYKVGNVAGEILSYVIPGMIAAKGAKAANASTKAARFVGKYGQYVDDIGKMIDKGGDANKIRQFLAARVRQNFTIEEAIQELMITGRYMGQNTARGGDTSVQSIATDAAMGLAGGLLVPARGVKGLFGMADETAMAADDVAGATLAGGADYIDNALTKNVDDISTGAVDEIPTDVPNVPKTPDIEVAPGVNAPNLVNGTPEPPVTVPKPTPTPATSPTTPTVQGPTTVPPVQQQLDLPQAPRVNEPPVYQQIEAPQKPVPMQQAPTPVQAIPETAPVTTPIKEASQEVIQNSTPTVVPERAPAPAPNPVNTSDEALDGLRNERESLTTLRDALAAEGQSTLDIDRRIAQLDKNIAAKVARPSKEATVLAEGDKQLEEAIAPVRANKKPEISKQEAPSKPKKETGVTTREMDPEEMRSKGMSEEAIANVMAKRATPSVDATDVTKLKKVVDSKQEEAPKVVEPEKVDVAQSETTPVKSEQPKRTNPNAKTVAEPVATPVAKAEPEVPKAPTQRQLNKAATENTIKSGKVSKKWQNEQKAAGATDEQIAKAVEKVEGRKVEPTAEETAKAEDRKKTNADYKERKAKAAEEGRTKEAAPKLVDEMSKQKAKEMEQDAAYFKKHFGSQVKSFKIDEEMSKAYKTLDEKDETNIGQFVKDYLTKAETSDDPIDLFTGMALVRRLESLRRAGKLTDDGMLGLADEVYQSQAAKVSKSGQVQRIAQEIYKNIPAKTRVDKKLDTLKTKLGEHNIDFEPTDAQRKDLVDLTDKFDTSATTLTGMDGEMSTNLDDYAAATTKEERTALFEKHQQLKKDYEQAQADTVANSLAFNDALKEMTPELPKRVKGRDAVMSIPDKVGNYLRMAMLSAPSGRIRDAISTTFNLLDDLPVQLGRALTGKTLNTVTKNGNYVDSVGSWQSLKKGIKGGASKIKSSWKGEYTLDEATGKIGTNDRSELLKKPKGGKKDPIESFGVKHSPRGSKWNLPKKAIRTLVQAPTDASYFKYTEELQNLGKVEARARGITDKKEIKQFAEMFADSPTKEAQQKAGQAWLSNSGMQDNQISKTLTKVADWLDAAGKSTETDPITNKKVKRSATKQLAIKTTARIFRTTTIPFVQYTGGATHAMFMRQNPANNIYQVGKAAWKKDPQKAIDELARGTWNTAKIGALAYALDKGWVETSDTDADGKTQYNGPYLVRTGADGSKEYVPASTLGIAGGAALIGGHYVHKFFGNVADGNITEALANITTEPALATLKATGMNNMLSGQNVFGGVFANAERVGNDPNKTGADTASTILGGIAGDVGSQAVPAISRDINTKFDANDSLNPTHEKPDTSGKDPVTGKVNPWLKAKAQVTAGIPVLSQELPRKSGELARTFEGRVLNANTQSEQQKAAIAADNGEKTTTINRTADVVKDDKVAGLLSEETRAIYDKYKGDMGKASQDDSKKIWKEVTAAKDRLLDDGSYESYSKILTYERDEAKAKGSSTGTEIAEMDRKIARSNVAKEKKTNPQIFRLYTGTDTPEGGGLSASEFKKMLQLDDDGNPKYPEVYDPETATLLWELDEAMTKAGASGNTNGIDPWTRNKYNLDEALGRGKYASGGSGKKDPGVSTDFGTLGAYAKPPSSSQAQKYQGINAGSPLPNLTAKSSKTNLRKNISVVKGVRL